MKVGERVLAGLAAVTVAGVAGFATYAYFKHPQDFASPKQQPSASSTVKKSGNNEPAAEARGEQQSGEYENKRYGFSVKYPQDWSITKSQNGDGATLIPKDMPETRIKVYGFSNSQLKPPADIYLEIKNGFAGAHAGFSEIEKQDVLLSEHPATAAIWAYTAATGELPEGQCKKKLVMSLRGDAVVVVEMVTTSAVFNDRLPSFEAVIKGFSLT